MEKTKEERAYELMGSFVYAYETRIKPLLEKRNFSGASILITEQCLVECYLISSDTPEGETRGITDLASKVDGYGNYVIAINLLMSLKKCVEDKERTERIKRVDYNIQKLDEILKDNKFYQEQRSAAA